MTTPPGWQWGDPSPRPDPMLTEPVDPWPDAPFTTHAERIHRMGSPIRKASRRQVFGRVYELFTDDPRDGEHPYVGQTIRTMALRVRGHKSKRDIERDPWKARIIDGPRGYRVLETVYATGDPITDQRELDRAEAFWIDRLRPTHNDRRPVRPRLGDPLPTRPIERRPSRRAPVHRKRRPLPWRVLLLLLITGPLMAALAGITAQAAPPGSPAPFVAAAFGVPIGWTAHQAVMRIGRKLHAWR